MFCKNCGLRLDEGNRFCKGCGHEVGVVAPAAANAPLVTNTGSVSARPPLFYAGFWVRLVAHLIDGVVVGIPMTIVVVMLFFFFGGFTLMARRSQLDPRAAAAMLAPMIFGFVLLSLFSMAISWLYFAGMESSEREATFGKAAMSLRAVDLEGRRLSFGHATGRFFAKIISGLIPLGIGYIMAGFTEKKQALHDMIAGTLVLRK
jgi:uncharacterized RDD family membrane protein YckC